MNCTDWVLLGAYAVVSPSVDSARVNEKVFEYIQGNLCIIKLML